MQAAIEANKQEQAAKLDSGGRTEGKLEGLRLEGRTLQKKPAFVKDEDKVCHP
jgi:hypothetical protein